ncbi:hypothetical protein LCGC14_2842030, partial [marine sediment metagenome]
MKMQLFLIISIMIVLVLAGLVHADTITVGLGAGYNFNNIQAAIDDSNDGDTIIVQPGLYEEGIKFLGKNITLTSTDPTDHPKSDPVTNAEKPPENWTTGDEAMTGAQASYLKTLCEEAGEPEAYDTGLTKAE